MLFLFKYTGAIEMKSLFKKVQSWLSKKYVIVWHNLCLYLLSRMKLSEVETAYMVTSGPKILNLHFIHDIHSVYGGCSEAREARREALYLERISKQELTAANVSEARQIFLRTLLVGAHEDYLTSFPPRELQHLRYHFNELQRKRIPVQVARELYKIMAY